MIGNKKDEKKQKQNVEQSSANYFILLSTRNKMPQNVFLINLLCFFGFHFN